MTLMDRCALEQFCVCGHPWWSHEPALGGCYARHCDCTLPPPPCTCPEPA